MGKKLSKVKIIGKVILIPINNIVPNQNQPRKIFDEEKLTSLAQSIQENGLIQPITVRQTNSKMFEIITGERRYRACKMIECTCVPAVVKSINDKKSAITSLVENIERSNLNFFEEAVAIKELINKHSLTQKEVATKLCKTQSTVANKLRLLRFDEKTRNDILVNNLTERHARALLRINETDMVDSVIGHIAKYKMNVNQTERYIETLLDKKENKKTTNAIYIIKDFKIFLNTIDKAIEVMKNSGIDAMSEVDEGEEYVTYSVKIPKKSIYKNKKQDIKAM